MLRVAFAGTPDFAVPTLQALINCPDIQVECVYTQPDRPRGRGQKVSESAVKQCAMRANLPVRQPDTLKSDEEINAFQALQLDALVVVAYGQILKKPILDAPRLGCLNVHASLLPRWRGAAPLQRAIQAGDTETGITVMQMDEGLDTGGMLAKAHIALDDTTTTALLHDQLATLGGDLLVDTLLKLDQGRVQAHPQPDIGITYASKISTEEALINWHRPASEVMRHIHAFNPVPGAFSFAGPDRLKIFEVCAHPEASLKPGELAMASDGRVVVGTGGDALEILACQLPGGKRMDTQAMKSQQKAPWHTSIILANEPL